MSTIPTSPGREEEMFLDRNKLETVDEFRGPVKQRRCTDCLWLILLIGHWITVVLLTLIAFGRIESPLIRQGRPRILAHWMDHNGQICDKFLYFPNPLGRRYSGRGNLATDYVRYDVVDGPNVGETAPSLYGVCVDDCPRSGTVVDETVCDEETSVCDEWEAYRTVRLVHFCVPHVSELENNALKESTSAVFNFFSDLVGDITRCLVPLAATGVLLPFLVGFTYLVLMRIPGVLFTVVWGSIVALILALLGLAALARMQHSQLSRGVAYVFVGVALVVACVACCMRKGITLAMGIVKEAARATNDTFAVVAVPFVAAGATVAAALAIVVAMAFVVTAGKKKLVDSDEYGEDLSMPYYVYDTTNSQVYAIWYLIFSYFWTLEFITAATQIVVASCAATWYFTPDKRKLNSISTVATGLTRALFFHAGTAALGSLVIGSLRLVRVLLLWLQRKLRRIPKCKRLVFAICCCLQCCMWYLEQFLRFLNKNAYICTAVFGYSFCKSARKAFFLLARNIRRVASLEAVGNLIFLLGKLLICAVCGLVCYAWLDKHYREETHSILGPTVFSVILAYYVGSSFVNVVDTFADTILICFVADEEIFGSGARFATPPLVTYINANHQRREEESHHRQSMLGARRTPRIETEDVVYARETP